MTDIQQDLYAILSGNAGVVALVGDGNSPQTLEIYPGVAEDPIKPCIIYQHISGVPENVLDGDPVARSNRIGIKCYDDTPAGARALADAVSTALSGTGYIIFRQDDFYDETSQDWYTQIDWKRWK